MIYIATSQKFSMGQKEMTVAKKFDDFPSKYILNHPTHPFLCQLKMFERNNSTAEVNSIHSYTTASNLQFHLWIQLLENIKKFHVTYVLMKPQIALPDVNHF